MKRSFRKMLTVIVTITMVFAVAAPVTAYYEQYSDYTFEYAGYDFEYENCNLKIELEQPEVPKGYVETKYEYEYEYGYVDSGDYYEYGYGDRYGYVDSEIKNIEKIESLEDNIYGSYAPVLVWTGDDVLIPEGQEHVYFSLTLDSTPLGQTFFSAPLSMVFPSNVFVAPDPMMACSAFQGSDTGIGYAMASFHPMPPTGMTDIGFTYGGLSPIGGLYKVTLTFRLNIVAGALFDPGEEVTMNLRRGVAVGLNPEYSNIMFMRGGYIDVTYAPGMPSSQTPGTAVQNMPQLVQPTLIGGTVTAASAPSTPGYNFTGWLVSGGPTGWTLPGIDGVVQPGATFVMPAAAVTLTAQWTQVQNQPGTGNPGTEIITVTFDLQGGSATFPLTQTVERGARISAPMPEPIRENFTFVGWYTAEIGGTQFNFATPITANTTIFARWQSVLIKLPDRTTTQIGDTINWTLKGFHNPTDFGVTNFAIVDTPGLGLNFQSGRLPAFTNGSGITYDIFYSVYYDDTWRTHRTGVDASRPYNFNLPQDGSTFYSGIKFCFGDVPVGFGLGNEIVLTFVVGYGAPNNELINRFFLLYNEKEIEGKNPDKPTVLFPGGGNGIDSEAPEDDGYYAVHDSEYFEIGDSSVPLGGFESYRRSNVPQTGVDGSDVGLMLISLLALTILKKRKVTDNIITLR